MEERRCTEDLQDLRFVIREVGLSLHALVLYGDFIVELCGHLFCRECAEVLLLTVDHKQYLPRVSVLGDASVLGAPKIAHIGALENFLVTHNNGFLISLVAEHLYKATALFQY